MTTALLKTKLFIPPPSKSLVARPHLIQRLHQGLDGRLTLISAPAGFGKTTLVSEWVGQSEIKVGWVSLDGNDNDIVRFLAYVIAGLQSIGLSVDEQLPTLMQPHRPAQTEDALTPLINQITDAQMEATLVLDDYHLIQNQAIHQAVGFLIENSPPSFHTVIITRADPPLPLARLRARGLLMEIRESDLRFTPAEGASLLNEIQGLDLSDQDVNTLITRTEGWAAALQMISIALRDKADMSEYVKGFTGSQVYIADYLTTEVLDQQPDDIKDFLLKTSILDRLTGPLCNAITGREDSGHVLRQLRDENLFVAGLDDKGQWYQVHQLFSSLLQGRLWENQPDIVPQLTLDASQWFAESGYPAEAIEYAVRGEHLETAAALIEESAQEIIAKSEINTFMRWIEALPEDLIHQKPFLCILYAWSVLVLDGQKEVARAYLSHVTPGDAHTASQLKTVQGMLAVFEGQIDQAIELAREALYQLPADDHFFRNLAAWNLSGTLAISGDVEGGLKQLTEVIDNSLAAKNYLVAIIALCRQGMAQTQYGNLNQAKGLFEQALDIAKIYHKGLAPAASEALGGLGKIYWEWNQFEAAREYLEESIQLSKRWRASAVLDSYVTLAHLHQSQGEPQNASRIMDQAYQLAVEDTISKSDDNYVAYQKAHLCLRQGDLPAAQRWASSRQLGAYVDQDSIESTGQLSTDTILRFELIVLARILIAETRYAEANHLLDLIYPAIETWGYAARKIEIHMLKALGLRSLGDTDLAEISLESALDLAEVEGYLRIFTDEGDPVRKILKEAHSQSRRQDFINSLLPAFDPPREPDTHMALIEPLSEREIEILRLLKSELTAPEIAAQLHIAVSTMRTHTKNIYGKLGAHSRFEAVTKAEELGII